MIETGKGDLQWERDIPPEALKNLENLAKEDFKKNMGKIIHDIYETAYSMFSDMPQGDHKKRAKYRFASKTLMRILPSPQKELIHDLIKRKKLAWTCTIFLENVPGERGENQSPRRRRRVRRERRRRERLKRRRNKQSRKKSRRNSKFNEQDKHEKNELIPVHQRLVYFRLVETKW